MDVVHAFAAIIEQEGMVFCVHRDGGTSGGGWAFPGGEVREGETPEQALRRTVREEFGAALSVVWPFDTLSQDSPTHRVVTDAFVCELGAGEQPHPGSGEEARWLSRDELLTVDWLPADATLVQRLGMAWDQAFATTHL